MIDSFLLEVQLKIVDLGIITRGPSPEEIEPSPEHSQSCHIPQILPSLTSTPNSAILWSLVKTNY